MMLNGRGRFAGELLRFPSLTYKSTSMHCRRIILYALSSTAKVNVRLGNIMTTSTYPSPHGFPSTLSLYMPYWAQTLDSPLHFSQRMASFYYARVDPISYFICHDPS
ncbi:unnamed protein product [Peniophora sp. CBMAI 1063]|nr:unnamed protein product [Peniophora sp. CBMAI 1063]